MSAIIPQLESVAVLYRRLIFYPPDDHIWAG
jgi:hypothetical protein